MLKILYETFAALYSEILSNNPTLASEHALAQEQEVYDKSTKLTYRNVSLLSLVHNCHNEYPILGRDILRRSTEETSNAPFNRA